jgi:hypothetical protein
MILTSDKNTIGLTYSMAFEEYQITKNNNLFEEVIDRMMLDGFSPEFSSKIMSLPLKDKRMAILSLLDRDRDLFLKIKGLINNDIGKMVHIKDVIQMLRKYVKVGEVEKKKFGEVMTPLELVKEMLANLPEEVWSNPNLKWLDPANGTGPYPTWVIFRLMKGLEKWEPNEEKRYKHIVENMIYVCELQPKNMFLYMCAVDPWDIYKLNIYTGSFLSEGFDKHMKEIWGFDKFDIVMGNPPYKRKLNLKFLNKSMEIADYSIFVHPSSWLIDEKNSNNDFRETRELHRKSLDKVILFNGNPIFGIGLYIPCAITLINKNKTDNKISVVDKINKISVDYTNIDDINKYSSNNEYRSIISKIKDCNKISTLYNKNKGLFFVNMSRIRGHVFENGNATEMYKDDFYTTIVKEEKVETKPTKSVFFSFTSEVEASNFLNYLKTNFCRFCLSICKNSSDLNKIDFSMIPNLDFTKEWTDESLIKEFNLTDDEVNFINKKIPKYYE